YNNRLLVLVLILTLLEISPASPDPESHQQHHQCHHQSHHQFPVAQGPGAPASNEVGRAAEFDGAEPRQLEARPDAEPTQQRGLTPGRSTSHRHGYEYWRRLPRLC